MNPLPETLFYMAFGRPSTASVIFKPVVAVGNTLTINGTAYTYGTNWGPPQGGPYSTTTSVRELSNLINGQDQDSRGSMLGAPHATVFSRAAGDTLLLFAREPGTNGNSLTLATNNASAFTLSGGSFSGGTSAPGTQGKQSSNAPSSFTILTATGDVFTLGAGEIGYIQNLGTNPMGVKLGTGAAPNSLSTILAAGTVNDDGRGGPMTITNWTGIVSVTTISAAIRYVAWKI